MICSYCGAEVDAGKVYCLICGAKVSGGAKNAPKAAPVSEEDSAHTPLKADMAYPRTHAALLEIFGPEETWAQPPKDIPPEKEEDWQFPVTPCTEWPVETEAEAKKAAEKPMPVYTTAPLRQDVLSEQMPAKDQSPAVNALKLPVGRSLVKMLLLGLITFGIYPTVIWSRIVMELNIVGSRIDGKRTMPYFGMLILAPVTLFILPLVWMHRFCNRVGNQLSARNCGFQFGAKTFWLWCVLGSLILVGPFVFIHKLMKSMNLINGHYNTHSW